MLLVARLSCVSLVDEREGNTTAEMRRINREKRGQLEKDMVRAKRSTWWAQVQLVPIMRRSPCLSRGALQEEDGLDLAGVNDLEGNGGDSAIFGPPAEEGGEERRAGEEEAGKGFELSEAGALPMHKWHPHTVKVKGYRRTKPAGMIRPALKKGRMTRLVRANPYGENLPT